MVAIRFIVGVACGELAGSCEFRGSSAKPEVSLAGRTPFSCGFMASLLFLTEVPQEAVQGIRFCLTEVPQEAVQGIRFCSKA
jgi:hypothetical protein